MRSIKKICADLSFPKSIAVAQLEPSGNPRLAAVRCVQRNVAQAVSLCKISPGVAAICLADITETLILRAVPLVEEEMANADISENDVPRLMIHHLQEAMLHWLLGRGLISHVEAKKVRRQLLQLPRAVAGS